MPNSQSLLAALKQVANEVAQAQADEIKRLRAALRCLAEGDTPWIDGHHEKSWEVMAAYAKAVLESKL